jgi:hypothetical protein
MIGRESGKLGDLEVNVGILDLIINKSESVFLGFPQINNHKDEKNANL